MATIPGGSRAKSSSISVKTVAKWGATPATGHRRASRNGRRARTGVNHTPTMPTTTTRPTTGNPSRTQDCSLDAGPGRPRPSTSPVIETPRANIEPTRAVERQLFSTPPSEKPAKRAPEPPAPRVSEHVKVPQPVQQAAEPKPAVSMPKQEQASQTQEKEEQTSEERVVRIANTAGMKEQVGFGRLLRPRM